MLRLRLVDGESGEHGVELGAEPVDLSLELLDLRTDFSLRIVDLCKDFSLRVLVGLVDHGPERAVLHGVLLLKVLERGKDLVALRLGSLLSELALTLDDAGQLGNGAFPGISALRVLVQILCDEQVGVILSRHSACWQHWRKVAKDLQLHDDAVDFAVLSDLGKAVAHDGDQHIQHGQLGEECRGDEEENHENALRVIFETVHVELTQ